MTRIYRRQRRLYIFTGVVSAVAIVNVLFFIILYRPARSEYFRLQDSIQRLQTEVAARRQRAEQLERTNTELEHSDRDRRELFTKHFVPMNVGFAQILPQLDGLAQRAKVRKSRTDYIGLDYSTGQTPQSGLYSLNIKIPVRGGYSNVVNFIKELEACPTFYIITAIDVHGGSETASQPQGAAADLDLSMSLETYFYQ